MRIAGSKRGGRAESDGPQRIDQHEQSSAQLRPDGALLYAEAVAAQLAQFVPETLDTDTAPAANTMVGTIVPAMTSTKNRPVSRGFRHASAQAISCRRRSGHFFQQRFDQGSWPAKSRNSVSQSTLPPLDNRWRGAVLAAQATVLNHFWVLASSTSDQM